MARPQVPPKLPRSTILPSSHKKGWVIEVKGQLELAAEFGEDMPATCPRSLTRKAKESGPPNVPNSCIAPFCQRKATLLIAGSVAVFSVCPTTWPRLLTANAKLKYPPRLVISPSFQRTALTWGRPNCGSITPFSENPAI